MLATSGRRATYDAAKRVVELQADRARVARCGSETGGGMQGDPERPVDHVLMQAEQARMRAAEDRTRAAEDRARASAEREEAAREREEALRNRTESTVILKLATTDELTGAWTRKFGLEQVSRELERAHRTDDRLLLAFIDVDGLKRVNDTQGHQAGDALLHLVGEVLRSNIRTYDVVVRYGGDEFVCAMPNIGVGEGRARFAKIVSELTAVSPGHSLTFGLAEAEPEDTLAQLIARADADLLQARREAKSMEEAAAGPSEEPAPDPPVEAAPGRVADAAVATADPLAMPATSSTIAFKAQVGRYAVFVVKRSD
jgi:diguanylate cyclase (GGDEF)-like protein